MFYIHAFGNFMRQIPGKYPPPPPNQINSIRNQASSLSITRNGVNSPSFLIDMLSNMGKLLINNTGLNPGVGLHKETGKIAVRVSLTAVA